ncbi:MAG: cytochrome c oxidase accessory protein CcoG [Lentimicrobium sp.]|nr:cytochrome c oxidase accessory protein CcoG [Lentimicrobium sp.]
MDEIEEFDDFRDRISTISSDGQRLWVYPKKPKGKLYNYRKIVSLVLLAIFFLIPFIKVQGDPLILLNILEREFIIFGMPFFPQDFYLFVLSMIAFILFVVLFTVIFGRIFCGWLCPQTIFMEFIYRQIEYAIEGNNNKQRKLDSSPYDFNKIWRKSLKHFVFYLISLITVIWFLAYVIGMDKVIELSKDSPVEHLPGYIGIFVVAAIHYLVFAKLREQVCVIICPYGRLQGVLLDRNSIVVSYDYKRGEPRGKFNPLENRNDVGKGNCIDCGNCVLVCPTGIDIRHGTQLECINCTACIDACNSIMKRTHQPEGLIRYASERTIADNTPLKFNVRILFYSTVLTALLLLIGYLFSQRTAIETTVLRMSGSLYQDYDETHYSNIYVLQVINKTRGLIPVELEVIDPEGEVKMMGDQLVLDKGEVGKVNFLLVLDKQDVKTSQTNVTFRILAKGKVVDQIIASFVGPNYLDTK